MRRHLIPPAVCLGMLLAATAMPAQPWDISQLGVSCYPEDPSSLQDPAVVDFLAMLGELHSSCAAGTAGRPWSRPPEGAPDCRGTAVDDACTAELKQALDPREAARLDAFFDLRGPVTDADLALLRRVRAKTTTLRCRNWLRENEAGVLQELGHDRAAVELLESILPFYEEEGLGIEAAVLRYNVLNHRRDRGDRSPAQQDGLEAALATIQESCPKLAAVMRTADAEVDLRAGRLREAEAGYTKALERLCLVGDQDDIGYLTGLLTNLAEIYEARGEWQRALRYHRTARLLYLEAFEPEGYWYSTLRMGLLQAPLGLKEEARRNLEKVAECAGSRERIAALTTLGRLLGLEGRWEPARARVSEAKAIAKNVGLPISRDTLAADLVAAEVDLVEGSTARVTRAVETLDRVRRTLSTEGWGDRLLDTRLDILNACAEAQGASLGRAKELAEGLRREARQLRAQQHNVLAVEVEMAAALIALVEVPRHERRAFFHDRVDLESLAGRPPLPPRNADETRCAGLDPDRRVSGYPCHPACAAAMLTAPDSRLHPSIPRPSPDP